MAYIGRPVREFIKEPAPRRIERGPEEPLESPGAPERSPRRAPGFTPAEPKRGAPRREKVGV